MCVYGSNETFCRTDIEFLVLSNYSGSDPRPLVELSNCYLTQDTKILLENRSNRMSTVILNTSEPDSFCIFRILYVIGGLHRIRTILLLCLLSLNSVLLLQLFQFCLFESLTIERSTFE